MERLKYYFSGFEEWAIDHDLHIYAGVLSIVAFSILGWMLYTEIDKSYLLRQQNLELTTSNLNKDREIYLLSSELAQAKLSISSTIPNETKAVPETVEKVSNKLNSKIDKVQNVLLDVPSPQPKVVTKTETRTIEKPVPVDSELSSMMRSSFCNAFPADKTCKVKK
jgi:hypothetical protein